MICRISLCLLAMCAFAGEPNLPDIGDFEKISHQMVAEWSAGFESLLESPEMTPEQERVIWRALNMSTVDLFKVDSPERYKANTGVALQGIMDEARAVLRQDQYIKLLSSMPQTQWFLMAIDVIQVPVCNCYDLCDCNDVAPRYTRCQNIACLTYIGGPTKVCQYTP